MSREAAGPRRASGRHPTKPRLRAGAFRLRQEGNELASRAIQGGLTLPPGYYRAIKRQIEGPTPSKRQLTDPEYLIELSGRQIVVMGGTLGAAGLISADVDVTRQVREGLLKLSDRQPALLARRAFAECRSRDTFRATG